MPSTFDTGHLTVLVENWGPRILSAALILVVAWFVARLVKSLLAKALDRLPLAERHNRTAPSDATVGVQLGEVAFWLVLLFGILAALNVLQLNQVVTPLNAMMTNFMSYVPDVVGAGLIFFMGFIVAKLASRVVTSALQAADLDRHLARFGVSSVSGGGLASACGTLVFVLIIVPVGIAALQALKIEAISAPAIAVLSTILNAIPNVVAAAIVLAIGLMIGSWIGGVVGRLLPASGVDKLFSSIQRLSSYGGGSASTSEIASEPADLTTSPTASRFIGGLVMFAIVAFSAIEAARLLHFAALSMFLAAVIGLAGRVILGAAIIAAGVLIGDMLAHAIGRSMNEGDRFAASLVKWATIALSVAMGLRAMGIADEIVELAFGLVLGSAAVAGALAFGLGAREAAGRLADRWVEKSKKPPSF